MKKRAKVFVATSALSIVLAFGATACSPGDSKAEEAASASASASAVALQSVDARSIVESFFATVSADNVSAAKSKSTEFKVIYKNSLTFISSSTVNESEAEKLVVGFKSLYTATPGATVAVDESKIKVDGDKVSIDLADLAVYNGAGQPVVNPFKSGTITVSKVDGKDTITEVKSAG